MGRYKVVFGGSREVKYDDVISMTVEASDSDDAYNKVAKILDDNVEIAYAVEVNEYGQNI